MSDETTAEVLVGRRLRELRLKRGLSLRMLADRSGLNINTLSLVENGKSSPSVGTLQQLALALEVPIGAFFAVDPVERRVVFTPADLRPVTAAGSAWLHNLGLHLRGGAVQPFVVDLPPGSGSGGSQSQPGVWQGQPGAWQGQTGGSQSQTGGLQSPGDSAAGVASGAASSADRQIVHTGHEFVFGLAGCVRYRVEDEIFWLHPGDSLVFEAHLPHCWDNPGGETAQFLLVLVPADARDEPGERHFIHSLNQQEKTMKIAVITDDGKTISRHFGRAEHYLVVTVENGQIVDRELRDKLGHAQLGGGHEHHENGEHGHGEGHGMDAASHDRHAQMAGSISDCQAVLCGGMGMGAYQSMVRLNIQPVVTDLSEVDAAVQAYIDGKLVDHTERLH